MNPDHIHHLENLAYGGLSRTLLPQEIEDEFLKNGYARRAVGGLMATDLAHKTLISRGIKPPRWR